MNCPPSYDPADDPEWRNTITGLALWWRKCPSRPQPTPSILGEWDRLLDHWVEDPEMPLLIRKGGMRGSVLSHSSGRIVVPTDNSPANWCFSTALQGRCPTLAETFMSLEAGHLPVAMMLKREEAASARYRGTLRARMEPPNLNRFGWKVCHLEGLGLNDSRSLVELPLETLKEHLRKFLHPRNMFLVPLRYSGVGELPEFLAVFRSSDLSNSAQE